MSAPPGPISPPPLLPLPPAATPALPPPGLLPELPPLPADPLLPDVPAVPAGDESSSLPQPMTAAPATARTRPRFKTLRFTAGSFQRKHAQPDRHLQSSRRPTFSNSLTDCNERHSLANKLPRPPLSMRQLCAREVSGCVKPLRMHTCHDATQRDPVRSRAASRNLSFLLLRLPLTPPFGSRGGSACSFASKPAMVSRVSES